MEKGRQRKKTGRKSDENRKRKNEIDMQKYKI